MTTTVSINWPKTYYQKLIYIVQDWQWQCGAVSIWLSWMVLLFFIQKIPIIGIYILMFVSVFTTFLRFSSIFLLFILGFSFSFYMLLQNQPSFDSFSKALLKSIVMMIGEYDYGDMFEHRYTFGEEEGLSTWVRVFHFLLCVTK